MSVQKQQPPMEGVCNRAGVLRMLGVWRGRGKRVDCVRYSLRKGPWLNRRTALVGTLNKKNLKITLN